MMMCNKCHDTEGPFICDVRTGKCRCEECYMFDVAVANVVKYIKYKLPKKKDAYDAMVLMHSIESAALNELNFR